MNDSKRENAMSFKLDMPTNIIRKAKDLQVIAYQNELCNFILKCEKPFW